jgi:hypothetical protein
MFVPRKNPYLAQRGPLALGKITNWSGKNPQGGEFQPRALAMGERLRNHFSG